MTTLAELRQANLKEQKESVAETIAAPPPAAALPEAALPPAQAPASPVLMFSNTGTSTPSAEDLEGAALLRRVRRSLSHKTLHPTGSKATVDMSPALFHRAKRYCMEHGNVTLRQVFLDLLTAFLEEEGY